MASMEMAAFSPDSRFLALSLRDQTLRLWSFTERRVVHQMADAGGRVIRLLVSPDNRRLATYEVDLTQQRSTLRGSVRLWDVATGQALGAARPHPGMFWSWQFDPDCRHLVVSFAHGNDTFGTQIWRLPSSEPVRTAVELPRAIVPSADAGLSPEGDRLTTPPNPSVPRIAARAYTADLRSWPASRTEHGVAAFEAAGIVVTSLEAGTP
jgi:WD40 repeat protein